ncbi:MAG: LacI family DNA-binding transcriptional regulator [Lachnospiraceae bacterium]|jgi:LacI family transcriptional regulator|nr:LacI family DNA-binding transcriptional regulator [Lachnospiraceae bacterium]MCH4030801.1 LacI family DNA-binding transcriptional regulator [Lachnospiraceae bacterium]MCH4070773.1 LacI family DNA-binding transcriptional regulator [Lachnospiraceae bacterium]MCH4107051.1 LacI family DNA-binding transcriptional regulator [Lachnospiraceae bacterium]MCI1302093.1 LacI family DNA-binding transcriptional regulator [Lachnospiraceae bacterium]
MKVTIQDIAQLAGVSRGTVDRAINHRGRISPEAEEKILKAAKELGYVHKTRRTKGAAGDEKKGLYRIGVITQLGSAPFMVDVNKGIRDCEAELRGMNIELLIRTGDGVDADEQVQMLEELAEEKVDGIAIMPVDKERVRRKMNEVIQTKGIPMVTFNTDILGTDRACFVGMDNRKSGRTAAGLMAMLLHGSGKVLIITGHFGSAAANRRVEGFVSEAKRSFPQMETSGVSMSFDDSEEVRSIIDNAMRETSGISGILVVSSGQKGIGEAFGDLGITDHRPYVIIYDQTAGNEKLLRDDVADFIIDQNGYMQGREALRILAAMVKDGKKPEKEHFYTQINIKTKYNL